MNNAFKLLLISVILFANSHPVDGQGFFKKKKKQEETQKKEVKQKSKFKEFDEVITKEFMLDEGLFKVYSNGMDYFFEIPFDKLDKDILWVSRIAKIPAGLGGGYVNAGSKTNEQIVHWSRVKDNIHLKSISYTNVADEEMPIYQSVVANNYAPVIAAFEIEAFNQDSTAAVVKVNDLFLSDVKAIGGLSSSLRKRYKVSSLDKKRSFIDQMKSFPSNIEVRHDMTYSASEPPSDYKSATISLQMSQSLYLLPEEPMMPRLHDKRIGWFTVRQIDFGSDALKADQKTYIRRWRLEPKDPEAYTNGELVEPVKPIVYYLDPATPEKWRPYFKQGIEDWQTAFEAAGFKNAIVAKDPPTKEEDPDWSPEDARYSVVRYVATTTRNAMGPSVSDPRSGEIIESDIVWYHNHLRSYRNRYMLETGAANPKARTLETPEEEIGEMMRMVIAHEVGHALGLPHNMKASYAYPTDSLRSATFTQKWGLASTLMDYTRYNYVAQAGDEGVRWVRMMGPYDSYAINWGYRFLADIKSPDEEKATLNAWIEEKKNDPVYLFGGSNRYDPSSQTESVGDDPVLASSYGLKNLKIVAENLNDWTTKEGEGYEDLKELYGELLGVWLRYTGHVTNVIGGVYELLLTSDQVGQTYTHVSKGAQLKALQFLIGNVFVSPKWLLQEEIIQNIGPSGIVDRVKGLHQRQLNALLDEDRLMRMIENEALNGQEAFTVDALFNAINQHFFVKPFGGNKMDAYERNLQRLYVERMAELLKDEVIDSDIDALAHSTLIRIAQLSKRNASNASGLNKSHYASIVARCNAILDNSK